LQNTLVKVLARAGIGGTLAGWQKQSKTKDNIDGEE